MVVLCEQRGEHTSLITINRPEALNAINAEVLEGLSAAFAKCKADGARVVVLTGAGKAFVAGADIAAMRSLNGEEARDFADRGQEILAEIAGYPGVVIAAVGGFALGGGMELAMACDLIIAGEKAKFGQPEVNLGVIPGFGGTQRLTRLVGVQKAKELILTGRIIGAQEAFAYGICCATTGATEVVEKALDLAGVINSKGPQAVLWAKQAVDLAPDGTLREGLDAEAALFARCFDTQDQREGMAAFLEKRPATFTGS